VGDNVSFSHSQARGGTSPTVPAPHHGKEREKKKMEHLYPYLFADDYNYLKGRNVHHRGKKRKETYTHEFMPRGGGSGESYSSMCIIQEKRLNRRKEDASTGRVP